MKKIFKILAINPGSTSTKIAAFENDKELFSENITHSPEELKDFKEVQDQLEFRTNLVEKKVNARGLKIEDFDVFVGRGGGLHPVRGGVYAVTETLLRDAALGVPGHHPAQLASQICGVFAKRHSRQAFVVNPPDTDEYEDISRITGLKGVYRESAIHALNQKEIALRYCASRGKKYTESNLIICHIGGGISVTAHQNGRMIDSNNLMRGEGPMAPTRVGALPAVSVIKMCFSGKYTEKELQNKLIKTGGLLDHLGTDSVIEVEKMISTGNKYASLVLDAMLYQIAKEIGSRSIALKGKVDAIILTGGISNSKYVVNKITEYADWIAPIVVMPGEFEMEALAAGALRAVTGQEEILEYLGEPIWKGFE